MQGARLGYMLHIAAGGKMQVLGDVHSTMGAISTVGFFLMLVWEEQNHREWSIVVSELR